MPALAIHKYFFIFLFYAPNLNAQREFFPTPKIGFTHIYNKKMTIDNSL